MPSLAFIAVILGSTVLLIIYKAIIHPALLSPLSRIPNAHWTSAISPAWILWTRFRSRENREVHAAHQRLGSVVRLGPNEISVNCLDGGVRTVYGGGFEKGQWYTIFDNYGVPCMFSSLQSRPHSARKRMISNVYSKSTINTSKALTSQSIVILYSRLLPILHASADESKSSNGVEVHELWNATTMDFITAYQFGLANSSNFLEDVSHRQHWLSLYQSRKAHTFFPQELPRFTKLLHGVGIRLFPSWVDDANRSLETWCADMCKVTKAYGLSQESYESNPYDEPVVLNAVLAGIEKEKRTKGSESILNDTTLKKPRLSIASEMIDQLAAGHETSGVTLTYLTWHLSHDISLQNALRAELLDLDFPLKYPATVPLKDVRLPDPKQLDGLPILHSVLMETLRLDAAIPGSQPRMTPYPSCIIGGYDVPGGVRVSSAAYSLHRNGGVFPDPEKWDHTRWLDDNGSKEQGASEAKMNRDRYFWAFSSGGRMCVGSNFAMHELKLVAAAIYTNFTTHVVDDEGIEQMDGYTCGPKSNKLSLRFEKVGT
ncbi:MAG: hypothetical protein M1818_008447 [Claussenomyces sp. TS43310]|nr:MAG: hypothetical protein M1818_008447 [Claussenomyces sp. TS43310]